MAGDWIKMRKSLPTCPKVAVVCRLTKLDTYAVCGRLLVLWSWADEHTSDGHAPGIDADYIDTLVGRRGFGEALTHEHVGWVEVTDDGLRFPDYEKHNGATGKTRAQAQRRQAKKRDECHGPVTNRSRTKRDNSVTRGEERREEENTPPKAPQGGAVYTPDFERFWSAFPPGRKREKGNAFRAWRKVVPGTDPEVIIAAAGEYAASDVGRGEFVKMPAPWLNGRCWEDDRSAWREAKPERDRRHIPQ